MDSGGNSFSTPNKAPSSHSNSGSSRHRPRSSRGDDPNRSWDPVRDLGLVDKETNKILCLGKTWDNTRCRRGPSANNNRPCRLEDFNDIQDYVQSLANLPIAEVATQRTDLLLDLAEAMMCLKDGDDDSEWKGHQAEQAAAQAYTWRRLLARKADLIRVPTIMRRETYKSTPKRRRDDGSPTPSTSNKRHARATSDDGDDDKDNSSDYDDDSDNDTYVLSQTSTSNRSGRTAWSLPPNRSSRRAWSPPPRPQFRPEKAPYMTKLSSQRLAYGIRAQQRHLEEKDTMIREIELELRGTRKAAARRRNAPSNLTALGRDR